MAIDCKEHQRNNKRPSLWINYTRFGCMSPHPPVFVNICLGSGMARSLLFSTATYLQAGALVRRAHAHGLLVTSSSILSLRTRRGKQLTSVACMAMHTLHQHRSALLVGSFNHQACVVKLRADVFLRHLPPLPLPRLGGNPRCRILSAVTNRFPDAIRVHVRWNRAKG